MPDINTNWRTYLLSAGYTGDLPSMIRDQLVASNGSSSGTIDDNWMTYLGGLGYTGSQPDRLAAHLRNLGHTGTLNEMLSKSLVAGDLFGPVLLPKEGLVNDAFTELTVGDWFKPYNRETLFQLSGGTGAVVDDDDPVGFIQGQRTTGTALTPIQATAGKRVKANTAQSEQGIIGTDTLDTLQATIAATAQPVTIALRLVTAGTFLTNAPSLSSMSKISTAQYMQVYRTNSPYRFSMYAGTIRNGSNMSVDTAYWIVATFDGASSLGTLNGVTDIGPVDCGSLTGFIEFDLCGLTGAASSYCADMTVVKAVIKAGATSDDKTAFLNWVAVGGDA